MRSVFLCVVFLGIAGAANAATCEDNFVSRGNALTGTTYTATWDVPDLKVADAIHQLGGIGTSMKYDVSESDPDNGSILLEQPESFQSRAIPLAVTATQAGTGVNLAVVVRLPAGAFGGKKGAMKEMCQLLTSVKGGKDGVAAAATGRNAVSTAGPEEVDVWKFSQTLTRQAKDNSSAILPRYKGRQYIINGRASQIIQDGAEVNVLFDVSTAAWRMPFAKARTTDYGTIGISCLFSGAQRVHAMSLKRGDVIKVLGTVEDFNDIRDVLWLKDCQMK